jgi:hypothetical protein
LQFLASARSTLTANWASSQLAPRGFTSVAAGRRRGNEGGSGGGIGSGGTGGSAATTTVATAEDLTADQAAIDLDQLNVQIAEQNLSAATLTSPLGGTVAAVSITAGSTVSAASRTPVITVLAPSNYQVATTAALAVIDKIQVGQQATVRVDGTRRSAARSRPSERSDRRRPPAAIGPFR